MRAWTIALSLAVSAACIPPPPTGPVDDGGPDDPDAACALEDPCAVYQSTYFGGVSDLVVGKQACTTDDECVAFSAAISCTSSSRSVDGCPVFIHRAAIDEAEADVAVLRETVCSSCFDACGSFASCEPLRVACVQGACTGVAEFGPADGG